MSQRRYCPTGFADYVDENGIFHYGEWRKTLGALKGTRRTGSNHPSNNVRQLREELMTYFNSECGEVPWQYETVLQGSVPPEFARNFSL